MLLGVKKRNNAVVKMVALGRLREGAAAKATRDVRKLNEESSARLARSAGAAAPRESASTSSRRDQAGELNRRMAAIETRWPVTKRRSDFVKPHRTTP